MTVRVVFSAFNMAYCAEIKSLAISLPEKPSVNLAMSASNIVTDYYINEGGNKLRSTDHVWLWRRVLSEVNTFL